VNPREVTVGIGVIGIGVRGRHAHEHLLAEHPAAKVRAVAQYPNVTPELLEGRGRDSWEKHAARFSVKLTDDYREVLARDDVHVISLMTEPSLTAKYVEEAAAAGKHIFLDKPMATTMEDSERIVRAVEASGVTLMVAFNYRYAFPYREMKRRIDAGEIGDLRIVSVDVCLNKGPLPEFTASESYRNAFGGGEVANFGCYAADLLLWLTGSQPRSVFATMATRFYEDYRATGMEDIGQISVKMENGAIGNILTGRTTTQSPWPIEAVEVVGTRGFLRATPNCTFRIEGKQVLETAYGTNRVQWMAFDFIDAVLEGRPSPVSEHDGLAAVQLIAAAYGSAETGEPIYL